RLDQSEMVKLAEEALNKSTAEEVVELVEKYTAE
ncbi:hypothetical protein, partial [Listeria seeligeri]